MSLGCGYVRFEEFYHPDGEPAPRIIGNYKELYNSKVVVVSRIKYPTTGEKIALTLHNFSRLVSNLSDEELYHAKSVDVLLPYFLLGRQDQNPKTDKDEDVRIRDKGRDIGYKSLIKTLKGNGANRIVTFNPHFHVSEGSFSEYGLDIVSLSGIPVIGKYFNGKLKNDTVVIGRDKKVNKLAIQVAKMLNLKEAHSLPKKRLSGTEVKYESKFDANGRDILAIDDCTTGGGIQPFLDRLINPGNVYFSVIHSTLSKDGLETVRSMLNCGQIKEVVATNTTISEFSKLNILSEVVRFYKEKDIDDLLHILT